MAGGRGEVDDCMSALHRAGRSVGDAAFAGPGGLAWVVSGRNGENLLRAEGSTRADAWRAAVGQARWGWSGASARWAGAVRLEDPDPGERTGRAP